MDSNSGFGWSNENCKNLSFFKIFQSADLSSENMRAFSYDFISSVPKKDISNKMVITTEWGSSWEVEISKNPRFYYMDKTGWNQFVSDNALGENEFITFTHTGGMCFTVNIFEQNGKEIVRPRNPLTWKIPSPSVNGIKKEQRKSSNKDAEKRKETGESSRKNKNELQRIKRKKVENTVPEFSVTIWRSYSRYLRIPNRFLKKTHIPNGSKIFKIHHSNGIDSWKVLCVVDGSHGTRNVLSTGWTDLFREYPLSIGDICTFKLIKPTEFGLVVSKNAGEEIITP